MSDAWLQQPRIGSSAAEGPTSAILDELVKKRYTNTKV